MKPHEPEFQQAIDEVFRSIKPLLDQHPEIQESGILERIVVPDRCFIFRVTWMDDNGRRQVNTGYRVQFNNALGVYKGGTRFTPNLNLSIVKFLAFEQTFKNALTNLGMGGAKGGADFDPKGKSDGEIQRFCQAYMNELYKYIGPTSDVPGGDMGVGAREIGYMVGQYKQLSGSAESIFTGKPLLSGGSLLRPEATGYGLLYFVERCLMDHDETFENKNVLVSGAGNVGIHAAEKAEALGCKVIGISDKEGTLIDRSGLDINHLKKVNILQRLPLEDYLETHQDATYIPDSKRLYQEPCDIMLFCATENEADVEDVKALIDNGCKLMAEGANMPLTNEALAYVHEKKVIHLPGKAANAGGVATSLMEMSQNATFMPWPKGDVDNQLRHVMMTIYDEVSKAAQEFGDPHNYDMGANIASFRRVIQAMQQQGI